METLFNLANFDLKLKTSNIGRNFVYVDEIDSTNTFLMKNQEDYNHHGLVLLAEKQTNGRGRNGRKWISEKGQNLNFSILITNKYFLKNNINLVNFSATLAVTKSISKLYFLNTSLKWPNDVLINNKKVTGILLEANSNGKKINRLIIGIGINVNQTAFNGTFNYAPTSIRLETKKLIDRETLLAEVLNNFEFFLSKIISNPQNIIQEWRENCNMIGKKITIKQDEKNISGIFEDIDENGFMILQTETKKEKIYFGDVGVE